MLWNSSQGFFPWIGNDIELQADLLIIPNLSTTFFSHQTYWWKGNVGCKTGTYWTPLPSLHTQPSHFEASLICKWMWSESHQRAFLFSICPLLAAPKTFAIELTQVQYHCPVKSLQFSLGVQRGWVNLEKHINWVQYSIFKICAVLQKVMYVL